MELLVATIEGTAPPPRFAPGPTWPVYVDPDSPPIGCRHPPGWQPVPVGAPFVGVTLYAPGGDALLGIGSGQYAVGVPVERSVPLSVETLFAGFLRQPVGAILCAHPLPPFGGGTPVFAAAQNGRTTAALLVIAWYAEGMAPISGMQVGPTVFTPVNHNAAAGPTEPFPALTGQVFLPVFGQLRYSGQWDVPDAEEDPDARRIDDEDEEAG